MIKELSTGKFVLETIGAKDITDYVLISNYGLTFNIGNRKYDVRFWANNYGQALNEWRTYYLGKYNELTNETVNDFEDPIDKAIRVLIDYLFNTCNLDD